LGFVLSMPGSEGSRRHLRVSTPREEELTVPFTVEELQTYFRRLRPVAELISLSAGGSGGLGGLRDDTPNPYYGQSEDLGVILTESYGMPHGLMTPLGLLRLETSCVVDESWREMVREVVGLEPYWGEWRTREVELPDGKVEHHRQFDCKVDHQGAKGPAWIVVQDIHGTTFPVPKTPVLH
jgi:hypothetical protein